MNLQAISPRLSSHIFGRTLHFFETVDSTNTVGKELLAKGTPHGTLILAEYQRAGRGRLGRQWNSTRGENLTFSIVLSSDLELTDLGIIPLYAGLAVTRAIRSMTGVSVSCKWPNDVMMDGRKICGILCESVLHNDRPLGVILGIGINVNQRCFDEDLANRATSLSILAGKNFDREKLLTAVLQELEVLYEEIRNHRTRTLIAMWEEVAPMLGSSVEIRNDRQVHRGIARGIADNGGLILQTDSGLTTIVAGDVTTDATR